MPRLSICLRTASLAPWPTATMAISAATPMNTPSMVSAERILLRASAWTAAAAIIMVRMPRRPVGAPGCAVARRPAGASKAVPAARAAAVAQPACGLLTCSSDMIWPSRIVTTRSAKAAMSASWVTTTMVTPCSRLSELQRLHDLMRRSRIEIAGRLVGKQQARRVDERARDRHALLLAAGELAGRVALAVAQAEQS